jgi:hypothetical protein
MTYRMIPSQHDQRCSIPCFAIEDVHVADPRRLERARRVSAQINSMAIIFALPNRYQARRHHLAVQTTNLDRSCLLGLSIKRLDTDSCIQPSHANA